MDFNETQIREIVQKVLSEIAGQDSSPRMEKQVDSSGVICVKTSSVKCLPFDTGKSGDEVRLIDVVSTSESPRLGIGIMEMTHTTFDWTLHYDEVDYIIEGSLSIVIDGNTVTGNKGDIIFIPKESKISFSAEEYARFMYVSYPADWQNVG